MSVRSATFSNRVQNRHGFGTDRWPGRARVQPRKIQRTESAHTADACSVDAVPMLSYALCKTSDCASHGLGCSSAARAQAGDSFGLQGCGIARASKQTISAAECRLSLSMCGVALLQRADAKSSLLAELTAKSGERRIHSAVLPAPRNPIPSCPLQDCTAREHWSQSSATSCALGRASAVCRVEFAAIRRLGVPCAVLRSPVACAGFHQAVKAQAEAMRNEICASASALFTIGAACLALGVQCQMCSLSVHFSS